MATHSISPVSITPFYQQVHASAKFRLGTKRRLSNSNEYIYVKGITSAAAGKVATFNPVTGVTALITADAVGHVGVFQATVDANTKFGWLQIYGTYASVSSDTVAGAGALYIDGTSGRVDDAVVSGDLVVGMWSTAADATNVLPVAMSYPLVTNVVG